MQFRRYFFGWMHCLSIESAEMFCASWNNLLLVYSNVNSNHLFQSGTCPHRRGPQYGGYTRNQRTWYSGDQASYYCDDGYVLTGSRNSRCMSSGNWSTDMPSCQRRKWLKINLKDQLSTVRFECFHQVQLKKLCNFFLGFARYKNW